MYSMIVVLTVGPTGPDIVGTSKECHAETRSRILYVEINKPTCSVKHENIDADAQVLSTYTSIYLDNMDIVDSQVSSANTINYLDNMDRQPEDTMSITGENVQGQHETLKSDSKVTTSCLYPEEIVGPEDDSKTDYSSSDTDDYDHGSNKCLICKVCNQEFDDEDILKKHERIHRPKKVQKEKVDDTISPKCFKCIICLIEFADKQSFSKHNNSIHQGDKIHECTDCKKRFKRRSHLKIHSRIHSGEKPFECNICRKRFAMLQTLKNHESTHTGERQHECHICGKKFTRAHILQSHILLHTGKYAN